MRLGKISLMVTLALGALVLPAGAQEWMPPAHDATLGVIGPPPGKGPLDNGFLVDLSYNDPGSRLPQVYPLPYHQSDMSSFSFLKSGKTYKGQIRVHGQNVYIDLQYGGVHFVKQQSPWEIRGCTTLADLYSAISEGGVTCVAIEVQKIQGSYKEGNAIDWREAEPLSAMPLREQFDFYRAALEYVGGARGDNEKRDFDLEERESNGYFAKLTQLSQELTPPPAIPEEGRKAFIEGAEMMKQGRFSDARLKFEDAIRLAPWWPEAYFNGAIASEKYGLYDEAVEQLNKYLKFNVSESDARDAKDRIYAIGAEKSGEEAAKQVYIREAAAKHVSGGAQRVRQDEASKTWKPGEHTGLEALYAYRTIYIDQFYSNVFRMPNGSLIAVVLEAVPSEDGGYAGDRIFIADLTNAGHIQGQNVSFGSFDGRYNSSTGVYKISVSERGPDGVVSVADMGSGAGFNIPLRDLYAARYGNVSWLLDPYSTKIGNEGFRMSQQGAPGGVHVLFFSDNLDPAHADPLSLTPAYVIALDHKDESIGNTGYFIRWHGDIWSVEK